MASHLDKLLDQIQRQGIAVTLVVASSAVGYFIMTNHNKEQLVMFKESAEQHRADMKLMFAELLMRLKK